MRARSAAAVWPAEPLPLAATGAATVLPLGAAAVDPERGPGAARRRLLAALVVSLGLHAGLLAARLPGEVQRLAPGKVLSVLLVDAARTGHGAGSQTQRAGAPRHSAPGDAARRTRQPPGGVGEARAAPRAPLPRRTPVAGRYAPAIGPGGAAVPGSAPRSGPTADVPSPAGQPRAPAAVAPHTPRRGAVARVARQPPKAAPPAPARRVPAVRRGASPAARAAGERERTRGLARPGAGARRQAMAGAAPGAAPQARPLEGSGAVSPAAPSPSPASCAARPGERCRPASRRAAAGAAAHRSSASAPQPAPEAPRAPAGRAPRGPEGAPAPRPAGPASGPRPGTGEPAAGAARGRVHGPAGATTTAPRPLAGPGTHPRPRYPYAARLRGEQGRVVLRVEVDAAGAVRAVSIEASSGSRRLDRAALRAVRRWRFAPATAGGRPVPGEVLVPITFRLTE